MGKLKWNQNCESAIMEPFILCYHNHLAGSHSWRVFCDRNMQKKTILGKKYSSWAQVSTLMKTMSYMTQTYHCGPNIKHQSRPLLVSVLLLNVLYIVGNVDCYHSWSNLGSQPKVRLRLQKLEIQFNYSFGILGHNWLCAWTTGWYNKEVQRKQFPYWQLQNSCGGWDSTLCWGNVSGLITNFNIINFRKLENEGYPKKLFCDKHFSL